MSENTTLLNEIETTVKETGAQVEQAVTNISELAHKMFLASLGAVMTVQDELTDRAGVIRTEAKTIIGETREDVDELVEEADTVSGKLVDRGVAFETDARKFINEIFDTRRDQLSEITNGISEKAMTRIESQVEVLLDRFNLPTKSGIEELNKSIGSLGRKVDKMRREQKAAAAK